MKKNNEVEEIDLSKNGEQWEVLEGDELNIWLPEEVGDQLSGVVIDITSSKFGNMYLIKTKEDEELFTPCHKDIQKKFMNEKKGFIERGDVVRITFKESKDTGKGNPFQIYKVERIKRK